ncbi:MAG: SIR2 family NAD-dependent protein deacylase [Chloroflexia bacterium]
MKEGNSEKAARLVAQSRRAVALTGAGISTPSGIRDFRSPGTGHWSQVDPIEVASIHSFLRHPERFYAWFADSWQEMAAAEPNPAHLALAELEKRGILRAVVTQNIDGLHQKAGSREVLELHGNARMAACLRCGAQQSTEDALVSFRRTGKVPRCGCGGLIKPTVVLFGEPLPADVLHRAQREVAQSDLLLVIGSSLAVTPAADLPWLAVRTGTPIVVCNRDETWVDRFAQAVVREDVAQSVPALLRGIA